MTRNAAADILADDLRRRLAAPLPGRPAQMAMAVEGRDMDLRAARKYRRAAVLVALFPAREQAGAGAGAGAGEPETGGGAGAGVAPAPTVRAGAWRLPLVVRVQEGIHGGQVALPGGLRELDESPEAAALREASEETGIDPAAVKLLGRLSPLPIPVSRTLVVPVVGVLPAAPAWRRQPREVAKIFTVPLTALCDPARRRSEHRSLMGREVEVPYFALAGQKIWGATAMILAELAAVLEDAPVT